MGFKSRGNWSTGLDKCWDSCQCIKCRKDKTPVQLQKTRQFSRVTNGIVVIEHEGKDGSRLEKPMSQAYINHIRSRNSESIKKMKPNMGAYGA